MGYMARKHKSIEDIFKKWDNRIKAEVPFAYQQIKSGRTLGKSKTSKKDLAS